MQSPRNYSCSLIEYRNVIRHYKQVIEENELPEIRFHDLRHTVATILLEQGINPKIVQEQLGHGTIKQTMDTYSHVIKSMRDTAANALNQAIAGNKALAGDD